MTGPVAAESRRPAALRPLVRLLSRALLGRRRSLAVGVLAAAPVALAAVLAFAGGLGSPTAVATDVYTAITLGLVVPLAALLLGTGALGTLIDDGTIAYLLVKPVPRWALALAATLVAGAATAGLTGLATLASGVLLLGGGEPGLVAGMVAGAALASVLYAAVFVALSVFTGRALIAGLAYVLVWEGLVTTLLEGTKLLSIREYALAIVAAMGGEAVDPSAVALPVALALSAAVLVGAYVLASARLARFEVSEGG